MSNKPTEPETSEMEVVASGPRPKGKKPFNNRSKRTDNFREKRGSKVLKDFRNKRSNQFGVNPDVSDLVVTLPSSMVLAVPLQVSTRIAHSSFGICLAVYMLFNRYSQLFERSRYSIHAFYRATLAQFEMQRFYTYQSPFSLFPSEFLTLQMIDEYRNVLRGMPDNFRVLIYIIEAFGRFTSEGRSFVSEIPNALRFHPAYVTFSHLRELLNRLREPRAQNMYFYHNNSIPGSTWRFDGRDWVITNSDEILPAEYGPRQLAEDLAGLRRVLEDGKSKYEGIVGCCQYSGIGKANSLVTTYAPNLRIPSVDECEPERPKTPVMGFTAEPNRKRARVDPEGIPDIANLDLTEDVNLRQRLPWYVQQSLTDQLFSLGILSFAGWVDDPLCREVPCCRSRDQTNSTQWLEESWSTLFDQVTPRVRRS